MAESAVFGVCASERLRTGDASTAGPEIPRRGDWVVDVRESAVAEEKAVSALVEGFDIEPFSGFSAK